MRKPAFCICENKDADQLRGTAKLISVFVFATRIVRSLYFLNPKFQASSLLLWLHSLVCVRPGRKPRRPVYSERGSVGFRPLFAARKNMFILLSAYTRFNNCVKNVSFIVFVNFCLPEIS